MKQRVALGWSFGIGAIFIILGFLYFLYLLSSPGSGEAQFVVRPGDGLKTIAESLEQQGIIRSAGVFKLYNFFRGSAHRLKPGEYAFPAGLTTPEVVARLVVGIPEDIRVLIPEGMTLAEIDEKLFRLGIVPFQALANFPVGTLKSKYPFLGEAQALEGFLFPDTYRFFPKSDPREIVERFLDNWERQASPVVAASSELAYDILIKASLVEKEIKDVDERPIVVGIINRRLALGMPLQVDATLVYAKCKGVFKDCPPLTKADLVLESTYNSYRRTGLPPTPISNPGLQSLRAAVAPQSSKFLFYLNDPKTGKTILAEILDEHNRNRLHYLP